MAKTFSYIVKSCAFGIAFCWSANKLNNMYSISALSKNLINKSISTKATDIRIREAEERDIPQLEELFLSVRQTTFKWEDPKNFKVGDYKKSTEGEKVFVAEKDQVISGFVSIWEPDSFIHNLFVYPKYQGIGIGKQLLSIAVNSVPHPVTMKVVTYNAKACSFYESQGWKKVSTHNDDTPPYYLYSYDTSPIQTVEAMGSAESTTDE